MHIRAGVTRNNILSYYISFLGYCVSFLSVLLPDIHQLTEPLRLCLQRAYCVAAAASGKVS